MGKMYILCLGSPAAVLSHKGSTGSTWGPEGSVPGCGHLHRDPGLSAHSSSWHASGRNEPRRLSAGRPAGTLHCTDPCPSWWWRFMKFFFPLRDVVLWDDGWTPVFMSVCQVVSADHACLLVPLQLEASLWRLVPGEETLLTHPLHWMVRRVNLEYFPRGRSHWDRWSHACLKAVKQQQQQW